MAVQGVKFTQTVEELQSINAAHNLAPVDLLKPLKDVSAVVAQGVIMKRAAMQVGTNVKLIAGGAAGDHTVTGILASDRLAAVYEQDGTSGLLADLTSEFSLSSGDTISNTGGTDTTGDKLLVVYARAHGSGDYEPWIQGTDHPSLIAGVLSHYQSVDTDTDALGLVRLFGPVQTDKLTAWTAAGGVATAAPNAEALARLEALRIFPL